MVLVAVASLLLAAVLAYTGWRTREGYAVDSCLSASPVGRRWNIDAEYVKDLDIEGGDVVVSAQFDRGARGTLGFGKWRTDSFAVRRALPALLESFEPWTVARMVQRTDHTEVYLSNPSLRSELCVRLPGGSDTPLAVGGKTASGRIVAIAAGNAKVGPYRAYVAIIDASP